MKGKTIVLCFLAGLIFSNILAWAQEEDKNAYEVLARMKTQLNLTNTQIIVVKPIIQEYIYKCRELMQYPENILTPSGRRIHSQMKKLKEEENKELSRVLTPDQMKKMNQDENVKDFLNQDDAGDADRTPQTGGMSF